MPRASRSAGSRVGRRLWSLTPKPLTLLFPRRRQNKDTYRWPQSKEKKPLVPYYPLAERNRLPVKFDGEAIPFARFCQERNVSQWSHHDVGANAKTRFRTTNMNTFTAETTQGMPVGFTNQGIVSEKTRWLRDQMAK